MKKSAAVLGILFSALMTAAASGYDVAALVWPAYQPEPRWAELGIFPHGNGEWQNVYEAVSKKDGHVQPKVPLWGYENEADPIVVARKIDAALAAGINVFIYDWYWYEGRPFLEDGLNKGFLKAPNNERMKFFLMWANHNVDKLWNNKVGGKEKSKTIWSGEVSYDEFTKVLVPRFIEYFKKPNHYQIDGKPVFSIFIMNNFVRGVGGAEKAREALEFFDAECKKAGFKGVHIMTIGMFFDKLWSGAKLPKGIETNAKNIAKYLNVQSFSSYNWTELNKPKGSYAKWRDDSVAEFDNVAKRVGIQYFPNVSIGWDNNPRYPADEFTSLVENSNPKDFEAALRSAKKWIDENRAPNMPKLITINSWNEWTEGGYLEPDEQFGYGFLNAVARVFGKGASAK